MCVIYESVARRKTMKIMIPMWDFGKSGGQRVLACLANSWIKLGHEVVFVVPFETEKPYFPIEAEIYFIDWNGNKVEQKESEKRKRFPPLVFFAKMRALSAFLKKHSQYYDVVIANYCFTSYPVAFSSKAKLNVYYIQAYEPDFFKESNGMVRRLWHKFLEFLSWLTYYLPLLRVVNSEIYQEYKNIRSENVVHPGLDFSIYYPRENSKIDPFTIGCIGRKAKFKGSDDVGEAVRLLHNSGYPVKLKVAFHPVTYVNHELVSPHGDKKLADFYRSLSVLVAPGTIQLGAVHYPVIEAMACNVPVITTGYYPASDKNAYIVPLGSPQSIANAIIALMNNAELASKKSSIAQKDISHLSWENASRKFVEIMENNLII